MSELTLLILRLAFLAILWLFIFAVVYALRSDLFGQRVRRQGAEVASPFAGAAVVSPPLVPAAELPTEPVAKPRSTSRPVAKRLVITSGPKEGLEIELPSEQLAIGRSSESGLVIRDDYTSTHHARLLLWNDGWVVQDLDSTNGTFLDGTRVTLPTLIPLNTPVTIGTTTFELRR
ncbi:MAG TPA: FHA domain-containing protein [Galbitalea sp.]|nr:FHA domain-containing protein [Galbitalea sp.]